VLTRRLLAPALALGLTLTACGSDPEPAGSATGGDGPFPVTLEHAFGTTVVPAEPQRVVTVGFNDQDFVLALGVTPVGTREYMSYEYDTRPWAADALDGAVLPTVGSEEIDIEAVAALEPDLIVGVYSFMDRTTYDLLSGIAPTVAQTSAHAEGATPWQEQTLLTGRALGREGRAREVVDEVEGRIAAAREEHPDFDGTSLALDYSGVGGSAHYLFGADDLRTQVFTDLGFTVPDASSEVSQERLDLLDQDVLVGGGYTREEGRADPLLATLDVVSQDRAVYLGPYDGDVAAALGFGSPLSLPYLLDLVVPPLAQAADGDPATVVEQPAA